MPARDLHHNNRLLSAFEGLLLSDLEYGVRAYHDRLRRLMPILKVQDSDRLQAADWASWRHGDGRGGSERRLA